MAIVPFLTGSSGLNNIIDPVRLKYNSDTGVSELAEVLCVLTRIGMSRLKEMLKTNTRCKYMKHWAPVVMYEGLR